MPSSQWHNRPGQSQAAILSANGPNSSPSSTYQRRWSIAQGLLVLPVHTQRRLVPWSRVRLYVVSLEPTPARFCSLCWPCCPLLFLIILLVISYAIGRRLMCLWKMEFL